MNELYNPQRDKTVVILGYTCSGKSFLTTRLFSDGPYDIVRTDDYIGTYGYEAALYKIMEDIDTLFKRPIVIEGVQGYRLLRKWAQQGSGRADLVITCVADTAERQRRYAARNNGKELPRGFDASLSKIWMDWLELEAVTGSTTRRVMYDTVNNKIL